MVKKRGESGRNDKLLARRIFDIAFDRTIDDEERLSEEQLDEQITRDSCPPRPPLARRRRGRRAP